MKLEHRLHYLELKFVTKRPGCNPTLYIVVPEEMQKGSFDSTSYRPDSDEIEKYLKLLKASGRCRECKGSCAINWSPDGFKNHTLGGECNSSCPEPKIHFMFCANAEIPILTRQIRRGEREPNSL